MSVAGNRLSGWVEGSFPCIPLPAFWGDKNTGLGTRPEPDCWLHHSPLGHMGMANCSHPSPPPLSSGNTALTAESGSVQGRPEPTDLQRPDSGQLFRSSLQTGYQAGTTAGVCFYGLVSH